MCSLTILYIVCVSPAVWFVESSPPVVYFPQVTLTGFCCFADGPQMLVMKPERDSYYPDDKIKVTAESNPSDRTYEWVNTATHGTLSKTDTITITEEMLGSQSLKVVVCCIIPIPLANTICKERQMNFTVIRK